MKILITGVGGFIGYNIALKFLDKKFIVIGIDNLNNYYDVNLKKKRISNLKKYKKFKFLKESIENLTILKLKLKKVDIVINLAAQAGVRYSFTNPEKYFDSNITGFINFTNQILKLKPKTYIYASSSSVYGDQNNYPIKEKAPLLSKNLYGLTKIFNEDYINRIYKNKKMMFVGLRFFTVYGPWGRPDMVMYKILESIYRGKKLNLYNHGKHIRDFTFVEDVVNIVFTLSKKKAIYKHFIFNICSSKPVHLLKILKIFSLKTKKKIKIKKIGFQKGDIYKTYGDNKKIKKFINFNKFTKIDFGINKMIEWYRKYNKINL